MLVNKGYEVFLPLYSSRRLWSDRVKTLQMPLFPGYVFCRFDQYDNTTPVVTTPGIIRIISFGRTPAPIEEREIEAVQTVVKSGAAAQPWAHMPSGTPVRITFGALKDIEGILVNTKTQEQLVISISLLQRSIAVQIDPAYVCPLGSYPVRELDRKLGL